MTLIHESSSAGRGRSAAGCGWQSAAYERSPRRGHGPAGVRLDDDDFSAIWADDDRPRIPRVAAEREALAAYLDDYRATVEMK